MTYRDDQVTINWHRKPDAPEIVEQRTVSDLILFIAIVTCVKASNYRTGPIYTFNGRHSEPISSPFTVKVSNYGVEPPGTVSFD